MLGTYFIPYFLITLYGDIIRMKTLSHISQNQQFHETTSKQRNIADI